MIATPAVAVTSELFQIASDVPEHRRDAVLDDINSIIDTNWLTEERFWSRQHSPFKADHGIALLHHGGACVAYMIVQRLAVAGTPVIYLSGTAVRDTYRGSGFFKRMFDTAMTVEFGDPAAPAEFCLCWRTRNPIIYVLGRAQCRSVVPAIPAGTRGADLDGLCLRLAATLYPSSLSRQRRWRCAGPMASFAIAKSRGRKPRPMSTAGSLRPSRTAPMRCSAPDWREIAGRSAERRRQVIRVTSSGVARGGFAMA